MIKIFSASKIIYLVDNMDHFIPKERAIYASILSENELQLAYKELINKNNLEEIYFYNPDLSFLFSCFKSMFYVIEAAGGLVRNKSNEWLFIFRHEKWDLPKGKIEKGESKSSAAIREVEEECGIEGLSIVRELSTTYHTYILEQQAILKPTYWFEMLCNDTSGLKPQTEEGITALKWLNKNNLKQVYDNTYESIKEVMREIKN